MASTSQASAPRARPSTRGSVEAAKPKPVEVLEVLPQEVFPKAILPKEGLLQEGLPQEGLPQEVLEVLPNDEEEESLVEDEASEVLSFYSSTTRSSHLRYIEQLEQLLQRERIARLKLETQLHQINKKIA